MFERFSPRHVSIRQPYRSGHIFHNDGCERIERLAGLPKSMSIGRPKEFLAGVAIATHFAARTPTYQAWIETLYGHVKGEWPHLKQIRDAGQHDRARTEYNTMRLHAAIGYVASDDEHEGRGEALRQAADSDWPTRRETRIDYRRTQHDDQP